MFIGLTVVAVLVALRSPFGIDYDNDAQPAIDALREGRFGDALAAQPLMGSFSLLVRAPFAELADPFEGNVLLEYRLGAIPCLLAGASLAWWLWNRMAREGQPAAARVAVAGLIVLNPMVFFALEAGHPEEVLGAALAVGAVLAAGYGKALVAGVALGLAIATKQWAVLAIVPTIVALPRAQRQRSLLAGAVVGAALLTPLLIGAPRRFMDLTESIAVIDAPAFSFSIWWPFASTRGDGDQGPAYVPDLVEAVSHPLIVFIGIPLGLLYVRRTDRPWEHALLLLALILLLRCMLDPVDNGYYHVPFLFALVSYEALTKRGLPIASIVASAVLWVDVYHVWSDGHRDSANVLYLAWAILTLAYLTWLLWGKPDRRMRSVQPIG